MPTVLMGSEFLCRLVRGSSAEHLRSVPSAQTRLPGLDLAHGFDIKFKFLVAGNGRRHLIKKAVQAVDQDDLAFFQF